MEIINRRQRMFSIARKLRRESKTVGFVPTMGSLHAGHLELVKEARQSCDVVIVSIFVNPTQFNDAQDLEKYPRDLTNDAAMLTEYEVDYIYAPEVTDVYPAGFSTYVNVEGLTDTMEGRSRPGHFRGVATVVTILLNTIRADRAFFGQKDAQQVAVIKRLAIDLGFETEIVVVPTVREPNGLAMSSRNERLSADSRDKANVIYLALTDAKGEYERGERNASKLAQLVHDRILEEPLAKIDYVSVVDALSLQTVDTIDDTETLIAVAVDFDGVRLIDNVLLDKLH